MNVDPPQQQQAAGPPESMNINNRWLPYAQDIAAAPDVTLSEINAGLRGVLEREQELDAAVAAEEDEADAEEERHHGHSRQGLGGGWNERGVGPHLKKLETLLALKLRFDQCELGEFLQVAYKLMQSPRLSMRSQVSGGSIMRQTEEEEALGARPFVGSIQSLAHKYDDPPN